MGSDEADVTTKTLKSNAVRPYWETIINDVDYSKTAKKDQKRNRSL